MINLLRKELKIHYMKTITISNQKGGVGKTTTVLCLSAGLAELGYKVLSVDLEGQRNLTATLGNVRSNKPTILEVLAEESDIREAIQTNQTGDFISGSKALSLIDTVLTGENKYTALRDALEVISDEYDYCIIDTPPALGTLTLNALTASDAVIIPVDWDLYSAWGLNDLIETIASVKKNYNKGLQVLGVLLTKYDTRTKLSSEMTGYLQQITSAFGTSLFDTRIRHSVKVKEIQLKTQGLYKYAPRATVTQDYRNFVNEVLERL